MLAGALRVAGSKIGAWLREPQPILRLELVRILVPLAALGFLSGRLAHPEELLGEAGFHVPDLAEGSARQPLYVPPLPNAAAYGIAIVAVISAICTAVGYRTRIASLLFALSVGFVALADRLAAFTVTKLTPTLALALFFSPAGSRYGVDAWRRARAGSTPLPERVSSGAVRFFQVLLAVFYCASGVCKARGEWLSERYVLWTHIHDSYQTSVSWAFARVAPPALWTALQGLVLTMEVLAPLWLSWRRTRTAALVLFLGMHTMIGLMFGPVKWFALLMIGLLLGSYLPSSALSVIERQSANLGRRFSRFRAAQPTEEPLPPPRR